MIDNERQPAFIQGSALLIMLWAIALLSAAVLGLANYFKTSLDEDITRSKAFRARQLAESGIALALHSQIRKTDPLLHQEIAPGERFDVSIRSEGSRFNPNVIASGEDRDFLRDIFATWGMSPDEIDPLIDALFDWIDEDDTKRLQGAENAEYTAINKPYYPRNQPMQSIDEMNEVIGVEVLDSVKPDWRDYFTVWSDGTIDVNEADAETIAIAARIPVEAVEPLIRARNGLDGEPNTEDDIQLTDMDQVRGLLGMNQSEFDAVSHRLSTGDKFLRVESIGKVGDFTKRICVVMNKSRGNGQVVAILEP